MLQRPTLLQEISLLMVLRITKLLRMLLKIVLLTLQIIQQKNQLNRKLFLMGKRFKKTMIYLILTKLAHGKKKEKL